MTQTFTLTDAYDARDRLISYDGNGNRTMSGYSTGIGNQLSSDGTHNYTYDANGNLITKTDIASGDETVYHWDFRNRLTEVDSIVVVATTGLATYVYDALDRRIKVVKGGATRYTLYDGLSPILDFNGSGTQTARYLQGPSVAGVDAVLARETSGGTVAWYLADRLGTVRDLVDNSGSVIDHVDYGVFGNVVSESSPSNGDGFKYAGMRADAVAGLYYDQARWYEPASGRFMSQDPSGLPPDANAYRYARNSPAVGYDPSGRGFIIPSSPPQITLPTNPREPVTPVQSIGMGDPIGIENPWQPGPNPPVYPIFTLPTGDPTSVTLGSPDGPSFELGVGGGFSLQTPGGDQSGDDEGTDDESSDKPYFPPMFHSPILHPNKSVPKLPCIAFLILGMDLGGSDTGGSLPPPAFDPGPYTFPSSPIGGYSPPASPSPMQPIPVPEPPYVWAWSLSPLLQWLFNRFRHN